MTAVQLDLLAALDPTPVQQRSTAAPAHPWDNDACTCGHTRIQHKRGKRQPWPATGAARGACTRCACARLDIDEAALARAEADRLGASRAELAELLDGPDFGLRYRARKRGAA